ncbi:MAG: lytic transglycosylase domain-containing protein [Candidatus Eisenbacteria bacterium]
MGDAASPRSTDMIPLSARGADGAGSLPLPADGADADARSGTRDGTGPGSLDGAAPRTPSGPKYYTMEDRPKVSGVEGHRLEMEMRAAFLREMLAPLVDALSSGLSGEGSMAGQDVYEFFVGQALSGPLASAWPLPSMVDPSALEGGSGSGALPGGIPGLGSLGTYSSATGVSPTSSAPYAASLVRRDPTTSATSAAAAAAAAAFAASASEASAFATSNPVAAPPAGSARTPSAPAPLRTTLPPSLDTRRRGAVGSTDEIVSRTAREFALPESLLKAVVQVESGGNVRAVSPKGAQGLMQLMPGTARELGVSDPFDPEQNVRGGAAYLAKQIERFGDLPRALAAYNAGPGAVQRHGGVPPYRETQRYVSRVLGLAKELEAN